MEKSKKTTYKKMKKIESKEILKQIPEHGIYSINFLAEEIASMGICSRATANNKILELIKEKKLEVYESPGKKNTYRMVKKLN